MLIIEDKFAVAVGEAPLRLRQSDALIKMHVRRGDAEACVVDRQLGFGACRLLELPHWGGACQSTHRNMYLYNNLNTYIYTRVYTHGSICVTCRKVESWQVDALQVLESCQKDEKLRLNSLPSAVWLRSGQVRGLRSHGVLSVHLKQLGESDFGQPLGR